jgi:carboxyl-terminal processing protease
MNKIKCSRLPFVCSFFIVLAASAFAQVSGNDRGMALSMLDRTKDAIKNNYYDPKYNGVDLDFVFEQAKERMKTAPNRDALMMTIASAVMTLNDSHTNFIPPARAAAIDYGWRVCAIGNDIYVARVKPDSDAAAKGLKPGDKLLAIDGFKPTRENIWQLYYRYFTIAPAARVNMTVLSPGEENPHVLSIDTKITKTASVITIQQYYERGVVRHGWFDTGKLSEFQSFGSDLLIWKLHTFMISEQMLDAAIAKARGYKTLVIDLRSNGGGYVEITKQMVGYFFDKDVKIGDEKTRKETKPRTAKTKGDSRFKGELIVLVDSESASAAEVFAKVIQLEKRGKVIGDRTMGAVMTSKFQDLSGGFGNNLWYGASVTVGDLVMPDGESLEKKGVTPDQTLLPSGADLRESKDPVLAYAAKLAGVDITPEKAGTFFPYEWPKQ